MQQEMTRLIRKIRDRDVLVIGNIVLQIQRPPGGGQYMRLVITCPKEDKIIHAKDGESEVLGQGIMDELVTPGN